MPIEIPLLRKSNFSKFVKPKAFCEDFDKFLPQIEWKFIVPDNYHERLTAQGFQLQQEFDEVLVDKYYDTHEHDLIKEDHWLRQRNGDWELKYPVGLDGHKQVGSFTMYSFLRRMLVILSL